MPLSLWTKFHKVLFVKTLSTTTVTSSTVKFQHELSRSIQCAALAREYWIRHAAESNRARHSAVAMDLAPMFGWGFMLVHSLLFGVLPEILDAFQTSTNASGTSFHHCTGIQYFKNWSSKF